MCPTRTSPPSDAPRAAVAAAPPDPLVGRLRSIGVADSLGQRLVLVKQVGAGGMGRVYHATDEATGEPLAVKLLHEVRGDAALARFTAEAEILESLDHPAIVAHVGHGTTADGYPYLAMAWLDGENLSRRLARGALSVQDTIALGRRLATGLAAAHAAGVIHRDLKPSNIMLEGGDVARATLIDFGIARRAGGEALTRTGELVGTPGYMAPEQVRGRGLDGRADLFALGCVLYQSLVGHAPFEGDEIMTVLARVLLEDAPRIRALRRDVPRGLERLIARLLVKDETLRPASAGEVDAALAAVDAALDGPDSEAEYDDTADAELASAPTVPGGDIGTLPRLVLEPPPTARLRRRAWIAPALGTAVAGAAAVLWLGGRSTTGVVTGGQLPLADSLRPEVPAVPAGDDASLSFTVMRADDIVVHDVAAVPAGLQAGDRLRLRTHAAPGTWLRVEGYEATEWVPYFEGAVPGDRWLPLGVTLTADGDSRLRVSTCADEPRAGQLDTLIASGACHHRIFELL
jgi:hypothetical protein